MTESDQMQFVAGEMRAASAVVLLGAGASAAAGYPLTRNLVPHIWNALDSDLGAMQELAKRLNRDLHSAKALIRDEEPALREAYSIIKQSPIALAEFKRSFRVLDQERTRFFSVTHDALSELLHRRQIDLVISLNWDTMLEAAYRRRYGRELHPNCTWYYKPHGDAADPEGNWVLPNEPGWLPEPLMKQLMSLAKARPRLLIILGYSENDAAIAQTLIQPLDSRWRIVRIGREVSGEMSIAQDAEHALPRLRSLLNGETSEVPGWEYIHFQDQNDLGAALDGRALGPGDVAACPPLPEVSSTITELSVSHYAIIEGVPGCGKSMVAYHTAHDFCRKGTEILRLSDSTSNPNVLLGAIQALPCQSLLLVDDSQILEQAFLRALRERANPQLLILLVTNTQPIDARGVVHIDGERAVTFLADALRSRREETLAIVRKFDAHVGDGFAQTRLEDRLHEAQKAHILWQFCFILTAGENRARDHIARLVSNDHADLLLTAIAARQLATLDLGASRPDLVLFAETVDRDAGWVDRSLKALSSLHLIVGTEQIRCSHQRYATAVLRIAFKTKAQPGWQSLIVLVRRVIRLGDPPLRGVAYLLRELWFADAFKTTQREDTIVDDETWLHLTSRCLAADTSRDINGAGFLIEGLAGFHSERDKWIFAHTNTFGGWITKATAESAPGLTTLLNDLINAHSLARTAIFASIDAEAVASSINSAPMLEAYAWSGLLGRLAFGDAEWKKRLGRSLDSVPLLACATSSTSRNVHYLCDLADGIKRFSPEVAFEMIEKASGVIAERVGEDFPGAYSEMRDLWYMVLGNINIALGSGKQSKQQISVSRIIFKKINAAAAASSITRGQRWTLRNSGHFLAFIAHSDKVTSSRIVNNLDFSALDRLTSGLWLEPPWELVDFVKGLVRASKNLELVQNWLTRHEGELRTVPLVFTAINPDLAVRAHKAGALINLELSGIFGWKAPASVLFQLAQRDPTVAQSVASAHVQQLADKLRQLQPNQCSELDLFIVVLQRVAPLALSQALGLLDPESVRAIWAARLRGKRVERRGVATLIRAAQNNGQMPSVVADLTQRFPGAMRSAHTDLAENILNDH